MPKDDQQELMLSSTGPFLAILASILGIPGLSVAAEIAEIATHYRERNDKLKLRRLETIIENLERRVADLERKYDPEEVDLFVEVSRKASLDDEVGKEIYYSAVLEWVIREKPSRAKVRVLTSAVSQLSAIELAYFVQEMHGIRAKKILEKELPEDTAIARLTALGLTVGGIRNRGNPTALGAVLRKYVSLGSLNL